MKIKFLAFLSFVLLLGATAFGVQNCSKKNDPIVGTWQPTTLVAMDDSKDLSCSTEIPFYQIAYFNQSIEFSGDGKFTMYGTGKNQTVKIGEGKWKQKKKNEYKVGDADFIMKDGKLRQRVPDTKSRQAETNEKATAAEIAACNDNVKAVTAANQLGLEYEKK